MYLDAEQPLLQVTAPEDPDIEITGYEPPNQDPEIEIVAAIGLLTEETVTKVTAEEINEETPLLASQIAESGAEEVVTTDEEKDEEGDDETDGPDAEQTDEDEDKTTLVFAIIAPPKLRHI